MRRSPGPEAAGLRGPSGNSGVRVAVKPDLRGVRVDVLPSRCHPQRTARRAGVTPSQRTHRRGRSHSPRLERAIASTPPRVFHASLTDPRQGLLPPPRRLRRLLGAPHRDRPARRHRRRRRPSAPLVPKRSNKNSPSRSRPTPGSSTWLRSEPHSSAATSATSSREFRNSSTSPFRVKNCG